MAIRLVKIPKLKWINISPTSEEDIGYLEKHFRFHHLDYKDCLEGVQRPKMDIYNHYLFMVFHFPFYNYQAKRVDLRSLNIFVGKDFIVTLTPQKDKYVQGYFLRARKKKRSSAQPDSLKNTAGYKLYKLIDIEFHKSLRLVNELGEHLSKVEDEVYSGKNKVATMNLAVIRRNILNVRRVLEPQLKIVDRLVHMNNDIVPENLSVYFDDVHDYLENMWSALENYRDTVDSLYNTNESFINQRTNEVIKMLTVISVAMLPLTLIASIYGMNVAGLPFAEDPVGLWVILFIMAAIVIASIIFAKKKKII